MNDNVCLFFTRSMLILLVYHMSIIDPTSDSSLSTVNFRGASKNRVKYNSHLSLFIILRFQRKLGIRNRGHFDIHLGPRYVSISDLAEY